MGYHNQRGGYIIVGGDRLLLLSLHMNILDMLEGVMDTLEEVKDKLGLKQL